MTESRLVIAWVRGGDREQKGPEGMETFCILIVVAVTLVDTFVKTQTANLKLVYLLY